MPATYERASAPLHFLHDHKAGQRVQLRGVPQIPSDVHLMLARGEDSFLTPEQIERADRVIWEEATIEIRRRHEAQMQKVDLAEYFGPVAGRDDDDEE